MFALVEGRTKSRLREPFTVNSLLTDAPNSRLTRYSGCSSMHGLISLYLCTKQLLTNGLSSFRKMTLQIVHCSTIQWHSLANGQWAGHSMHNLSRASPMYIRFPNSGYSRLATCTKLVCSTSRLQTQTGTWHTHTHTHTHCIVVCGESLLLQ